MNKNKTRRNRPDYDGAEIGLFRHNKALLRKTATICAICGLPLDKSLKYPDPMSISIDHILPVARGGRSTIDNLQAVHLVCNKAKGSKLYANNQGGIVSPTTERQKSIPQYIDWTSYKG